ncbi:MAG TPA: poly(R)-hydroxyalkanoic acid synthase subunit PhaE, partial [Dokdonella sp.]
LSEREQPGRQIESLRALYDLWVDAAEEGYAEIVLTEEYREAYGALVNAQMRMRAHVQQEVERIAGELGMPTRTELNTIGERLQALRREVREQGTGAERESELAAVRAELASLKSAIGAAARAKAPAAAESPPAGAHAAALAPAARPPRHAVRARKLAPPRKRVVRAAAAPKRRAGERAAGRSVAASAVAGSFASRIAKFADASLGGARVRSTRANGRGAKNARPKR